MWRLICGCRPFRPCRPDPISAYAVLLPIDILFAMWVDTGSCFDASRVMPRWVVQSTTGSVSSPIDQGLTSFQNSLQLFGPKTATLDFIGCSLYLCDSAYWLAMVSIVCRSRALSAIKRTSSATVGAPQYTPSIEIPIPDLSSCRSRRFMYVL